MKTNFLSCLFLLVSFFFFVQTTVRSQIVNIEERRITGMNDSTHWYGYIRLGANISKVKDKVLQFNSRGQLQYKKNKHLTLLLVDGRFLRAGNKDFNKAGFLTSVTIMK